MSIFPISGENRDPLGLPMPAIVYYVDSAMQGAYTYINASSIEYKTPDYAKELLDRVRYLRKAYTKAFAPHGVAPNARAFNEAEAFIKTLPLNRTGLPTINVASDGEVNFDWSSGISKIDLGFFGNGTYSYYARGGNYGEISGDDIAVGTEVPEQLIKIASVTG